MVARAAETQDVRAAVDGAGRRLGGQVRRWFAVVIPVFTVPLQVEQLLPGDFGRGTSLPLQVCDLAWVVAAHALFTPSPRASRLLYYWGLTLVTQAILTPSLSEAFPQPRYLMFWGMHFLTVWAAVLLTFGLGLRPTWSGFRFAVACTLGWAVAVTAFNAVAHTDYGYLNAKPQVHTLLDLFGPWPVYVVVEIAVVTGVRALITWPWTRASRPATVPSRSVAITR